MPSFSLMTEPSLASSTASVSPSACFFRNFFRPAVWGSEGWRAHEEGTEPVRGKAQSGSRSGRWQAASRCLALPAACSEAAPVAAGALELCRHAVHPDSQ